MATFFSNRRGFVVPVRIPGGINPSPVAIRMNNFGLGGNADVTGRSIFTQMSLDQEGSFDAKHTLDDSLYVYTFGNRAGDIVIGGVCFANTCVVPRGGNPVSGMEQVLDAYARNRLSVAGAPVQIQLGNSTFRGVCKGMRLDIADPERNVGQWVMRFLTFPRT